MSIKSNLTKRRPKKVTVFGDDFYVVSMTIAESEHVDAISKDESRNGEIVGYCLTRCLVEENGGMVLDPETTDAQGKVTFDPTIKQIPLDTASALAQEIRNVSNPQSVESAKKN